MLSTQVFGATYESSNRSSTPQIKFSYPEADWEVLPNRAETEGAQQVDKTMAQQTLVVVQKKQPDDKYRARFHVVTDSLDKFKEGKVPLIVQYQKYTVDFLKSQRCLILSTEPIQLPHVKDTAVEVVANQRDFGLKFKQVIFIHDGKAYLLTATTRTQKFDDYKKEINQFFETFQFVQAAQK